MDSYIQVLLSQAPGAVVAAAIVILIIYVLREYRKVRLEADKSIQDAVDAKVGHIMSKMQDTIEGLEAMSRDQESKLSAMESAYREFQTDIADKATSVNNLFNEARAMLGELRDAIPNVDEYSARDILGIAQTKDTAQAKAELCQRILEHPDATSRELEAAGDLMREANRYSLAVALYEAATNKDPEAITARIELLCLKAEIDYSQREQSLHSAIDISLERPSPTTFARVANALMALGRFEKLAQYSDDFIAKLGNRTPILKALALRNRGVAFKELGDIDKSIEAFNMAFSISPEDENILKPYLGVLEEQRKYSDYLEVSRKLIDMDPADFAYYRIYIAALLRSGAYSEAEKWIEIARNLPMDHFDQAALKGYERKVEAAAKKMLQPADIAAVDKSGGKQFT